MQIRPFRRHQRLGSIGQYEGQPPLAATVTPSEDLEDRSLERMVGSNDGYLSRVSVEMTAEVGSLSSGPSTRSRTLS